MEKMRNDITFKNEKEVVVHRGDVVLVDMPRFKDEKKRSIQAGIRPYLIISNELNNKYSGIVTAVALTTRTKKMLPTHVMLPKNIYGLNEDSTVVCEQIFTISKVDILKKYDIKIDEVKMKEIENALLVQQGFAQNKTNDKYIMDRLKRDLEKENEKRMIEYKNNLLRKLKGLGLDNSALSELAIM